MIQRLSTVNVIEMVDDIVQSLRSFPDNSKGNRDAERLFKALLKENNDSIAPVDVNAFLNGGSYYDSSGYKLLLIHSMENSMDYDNILESLLRMIARGDEEFQEQIARGIGINTDELEDFLIHVMPGKCTSKV